MPHSTPRRSPEQLRIDARSIWQAGVAAVDSERLVREHMRVEGAWLQIGDPLEPEPISLGDIGRILVVGAGKAGAGMAAGVEVALGERLCREKQLSGWVNVPANCVRPLPFVHLHAGRPAGVNEPTLAGVEGTQEILRRVGLLGENDLCLCLLSGGGSALLTAPVEGVSLAEKQALTRFLSGAGAHIGELNTVRKHISDVKGGRLAQACRAGHLVTLIISDVPGDPLDLIASGPTVPDLSTPGEALAILERYEVRRANVASAAISYLERMVGSTPSRPFVERFTRRRHEIHAIIGNNATAVDAAGLEAERRGYSHAMVSSRTMEPAAEEVGRQLANLAVKMRREPGPDCLISGGEPVVKLAPAAERGLGGRNQQLVLAALARLLEMAPGGAGTAALEGLALLSGGTDGEDGPTNAAGAFIDYEMAQSAQKQQLHPAEFLQRNNAYNFFAPLGGLILTGPTHTNVCDLRVVVVDRVQTA